MTTQAAAFSNSKRNKLIFFFSVLVAVIWLLSQTINIYRFAVVGAIFELLWLPVLVSIPVLTIMALIFWIKDKCHYQSLNLYALLVLAAGILIPIVFR